MAGFDRGSKGGGFKQGGFDKSRGAGFRPGSRPSFGGRDGNRGDRSKEMFDAICSSCGKDCQVPFRPSGGKPVFCRDCFSKEGGGRELGRQAGERGHRRDDNFGDRDRVPMRMSAPAGGDGTNGAEDRRQLEQVNIKLERLISAVQALALSGQATKTTKPAAVSDNKTLGTVLKEVTKTPAKKFSKKSPKK
jgi:CxxC-x17-CxxC domain-containing protein